jgi:PIN domain nuclease of toxin-antitoxin system
VNVLDSSAVLAFLQGEEGADVVEDALGDGGMVSTANWSEIAQKVRAHGRNWDLASALLASYDLRVEPVSVEDAERAAAAWRPGDGHSLADRLCMALGSRLDGDVLTADRAWGTAGRIRQVR